MHREFIDRLLQQFVARSRQQERLWSIALNGRFRSLFLLIEIERYGHCNFQALPRGQERIAQDAIHPSPKISPQLEGRKSSQTLGVGFLDQVFGLFSILGQPVSKVVELVEERHGQFFELAGLEAQAWQPHKSKPATKAFIQKEERAKKPTQAYPSYNFRQHVRQWWRQERGIRLWSYSTS